MFKSLFKSKEPEPEDPWVGLTDAQRFTAEFVRDTMNAFFYQAGRPRRYPVERAVADVVRQGVDSDGYVHHAGYSYPVLALTFPGGIVRIALPLAYQAAHRIDKIMKDKYSR